MTDLHTLTVTLESIVHNPARPLASLSVAVFDAAQIRYSQAFGMRRFSAESPPPFATPNTLYRIASISKHVATLGAMLLVERGQLDLDADLSTHFDFIVQNPYQPDAAITPRMLLSHTSSIRDGGELYSAPPPYTIADFLLPEGKLFAGGVHWADETEPAGRHFCYSNLNFGLLGTLIERLSHQRFDRFMRDEILEPLGIAGSYGPFGLNHNAFDTLATLYRKRNEHGVWDAVGPWVPQVDAFNGQRPTHFPLVENPDVATSMRVVDDGRLRGYRLGENATLFSPQGGLRISTLGLARIGRLLLGDGVLDGERLLSAETIAALHRPQWRYQPQAHNGDTMQGLMRCWGLGTQVITGFGRKSEGDKLFPQGSEQFWGHSGEAYGLLSGLWVNSEHRVGFAYAIGGTGGDPAEHPGTYSSFTQCEEAVMTALQPLLRDAATMR